MNADILSLSYPLTRLVLWLVLIFAFIGLNALILVWVERKVAGYVQLRPGPLHVGPIGLLQPLVDAIKLMAKQLVTPACRRQGPVLGRAAFGLRAGHGLLFATAL